MEQSVEQQRPYVSFTRDPAIPVRENKGATLRRQSILQKQDASLIQIGNESGRETNKLMQNNQLLLARAGQKGLLDEYKMHMFRLERLNKEENDIMKELPNIEQYGRRTIKLPKLQSMGFFDRPRENSELSQRSVQRDDNKKKKKKQKKVPKRVHVTATIANISKSEENFSDAEEKRLPPIRQKNAEQPAQELSIVSGVGERNSSQLQQQKQRQKPEEKSANIVNKESANDEIFGPEAALAVTSSHGSETSEVATGDTKSSNRPRSLRRTNSRTNEEQAKRTELLGVIEEEEQPTPNNEAHNLQPLSVALNTFSDKNSNELSGDENGKKSHIVKKIKSKALQSNKKSKNASNSEKPEINVLVTLEESGADEQAISNKDNGDSLSDPEVGIDDGDDNISDEGSSTITASVAELNPRSLLQQQATFQKQKKVVHVTRYGIDSRGELIAVNKPYLVKEFMLPRDKRRAAKRTHRLQEKLINKEKMRTEQFVDKARDMLQDAIQGNLCMELSIKHQYSHKYILYACVLEQN